MPSPIADWSMTSGSGQTISVHSIPSPASVMFVGFAAASGWPRSWWYRCQPSSISIWIAARTTPLSPRAWRVVWAFWALALAAPSVRVRTPRIVDFMGELVGVGPRSVAARGSRGAHWARGEPTGALSGLTTGPARRW